MTAAAANKLLPSPMCISITPEFVPRAWAPFDASDALAFYLANPLLAYYFSAAKMQATKDKAESLTSNDDKLHLTWKLREVVIKSRRRRPLPEGLAEMSMDDFRQLCLRIEDKSERDAVRVFGQKLLECELPWFAAHVEAILAAREAAPTT